MVKLSLTTLTNVKRWINWFKKDEGICPKAQKIVDVHAETKEANKRKLQAWRSIQTRYKQVMISKDKKEIRPTDSVF